MKRKNPTHRPQMPEKLKLWESEHPEHWENITDVCLSLLTKIRRRTRATEKWQREEETAAVLWEVLSLMRRLGYDEKEIRKLMFKESEA